MNPRPSEPQSDALTKLSYAHHKLLQATAKSADVRHNAQANQSLELWNESANVHHQDFGASADVLVADSVADFIGRLSYAHRIS